MYITTVLLKLKLKLKQDKSGKFVVLDFELIEVGWMDRFKFKEDLDTLSMECC